MLAILAEVAGTTSIKLSEGFTRLVPSVAIFVFYGLSLGMLNLALKEIDLSFAYAVWSGIGMALIAMVGIYWFSEPIGTRSRGLGRESWRPVLKLRDRARTPSRPDGLLATITRTGVAVRRVLPV